MSDKSFKPSLLLVASSVICMIAVGVTVWATHKTIRPSQANMPGIENKTQLFHLINLDQSGRTTRLLFRNDYNKNITAFQLSIDNAEQQIDLIYADDVERQVIAPGQTFQYLFPSPSGHRVQRISIQAVVFEDGSSDGDTTVSRQIIDMHQGIKAQYKKFLPLLKSILDSSNADTEEALNKLESQVLKLTTDYENTTLSSDFRFGLQSAKESIINEIQKVKFAKQKYGNIRIQNALLRLKEKHEKRVARL
ncbi:MAG TPA: hypothetical protein VFQ47_04400 [Nitrososphaera sp.]|jgi:hypothetical protein|nr:hypothetical protein [Nitrososphaera sp.]